MIDRRGDLKGTANGREGTANGREGTANGRE
jgi:hypothetical protein